MAALNHAGTRSAFGLTLSEHPLMQNVLADLCVEAEAHTITAFYMAVLYDRVERATVSTQRAGTELPNGHPDIELFRTAVSVAKYYVTKRQPNFAYECMEVFGGNGFVEDFPMVNFVGRHTENSYCNCKFYLQ